MQHWPFWLAGAALGVSTLLYIAWVRRPFGVSGAVAGLIRVDDEGDEDGACDAAASLGSPLLFRERAAFLGSIVVGAAASALLAGTWGVSYADSLGSTFRALWGEAGLPVLVVGGVLVGFGTQLARGCTSGHGLTGIGRFQLPSLVATATFFGTAIATSLVVDALLRGGQ